MGSNRDEHGARHGRVRAEASAVRAGEQAVFVYERNVVIEPVGRGNVGERKLDLGLRSGLLIVDTRSDRLRKRGGIDRDGVDCGGHAVLSGDGEAPDISGVCQSADSRARMPRDDHEAAGLDDRAIGNRDGVAVVRTCLSL